MVKQSELFKLLKICLVLVSLTLREIGKRSCLWWIFLIKIVFIYSSLWLLKKPCMVGGVVVPLCCLRFASLRFMVLTLSIREKRKFIS